jgi:hypothetical protein
MASSSAALWQDIVERVGEVRASQVRLADAIKDLGLVFHGALECEAPQAEAVEAVGARAKSATLDYAGPDASRRAPPPPPPPPPPWVGAAVTEPPASRRPDGDVHIGFKDAAPPADSDITSVDGSTQRAWSGAAEVAEPAVETGVPEPVFYVPPFDEEVLPATSVTELSESALDAVLVSEFGPETARTTDSTTSTAAGGVSTPEASASGNTPHVDSRQTTPLAVERPAPDPGPARVPPATEASHILDILLGTPGTAGDAVTRTDASATSGAVPISAPETAPVAASAPPVPLMASPPPPPPPPVFTSSVEAPPPVFTPSVEAPPPPPVFAPPVEVPPPSPVFVVPDPPEAATPVLAVPPPPLPPPPAAPADTVDALGFSIGEAVPEAAPGPSSSSFEVTPVPAVVSNGSDPSHAVADTAAEGDEITSDATGLFTSAASMATEILSATPEVAFADLVEEPTGDQEAELISKDVTLIARGRKKRFRLH